MPNNILELMGNVQAGFDRGEARRKRNALADLAGAYAAGGDPDFAGIAANGGDPLAFRDDARKQEDSLRASLGQDAALLLSAPPQARSALYRQNLPKYRHFFQAAPEDYSPELDPVLEQLAGKQGGEQYTLSPGSVRYDASGNMLASNMNFAPKDPYIWSDVRGGFVRRPDAPGATGMPSSGAPLPQGEGAGGDLAGVFNLAARYRFQPTSFGRSPEENARLPGAARNSDHLREGAMDFSIQGKSPQEIQQFIADMESIGWVGGIHTKGSAPHLHFKRPGEGAVGSDAPAPAGGADFIPVVPPKDTGSEESFGQPQEVKDPVSGQSILVQVGNRGTVRRMEGYGVADNSASADKERMQRDRMVAQLSKRLADEQVPLIETQLGTIESTLRPFADKDGHIARGKDIPGYGRGDSLVPNFAASTDALDLRQQVQSLANVVLKSRSGAAVTDQELRRFLVEAGSGKLMPEEQLLKGVRLMRNWFNAQKQNVRGGYSPEVLQAYYDNAPENTDLLGPLAPAAEKPRSPAATGPKPGDVEDGYQFKGGNPGDPNNWVKAAP